MSICVAPLGEVATIVAGQSPPGHTYNQNGEGLPFFQGKADFGEIHPIARKWCVAPRKIAEAGDILISVRAPVGPTNVAGERCCIGRGLAAIRPNETRVLRDFVLWHIRRSEPALVANGQGTTFSAIGKKDIESLPIPTPSLDEQRRIVGILNRAAKIERLRTRGREIMREFIPSLFIKMFGDPIDNPNGHRRKPLSECAAFVSGATPSKQNRMYWDGDVPWITAKDMKVDLIADSEDHVTKLAFDETNLRLVPANTPIMVVRGMILSHTVPIALTARAVTINQDMKAVRFDSAIDPTFGLWCLKSLSQRILEEVDTAAHGTKRLEMSRLGALPILIPSRELQCRFIGIVRAARTVASQAESSGQDVLTLIGSLMSRLLADFS